MTSSTDLQALLDLPLLQRIPGDARERVATLLHRVSTRIAVSDGEILLLQGNVGGDMGFVLLRGAVEIDREETAPIAVSAPALLGEMLQFNPSAQRTATVRVAGDAECLRFPWQDFYAQARRDLSEAEQDMLMDSMERCIWERLGRDTLIDLALFRGVSDQLKLRACLLLQWIVRRAVLSAGEQLFAQDDLCGGAGYILTRGSFELTRPNHPAAIVGSPNLLGVMPRFDPDRRWSATAIARETAELLRFSWLEYEAMLQRRLSQREQQELGDAIAANAAAHFVA